MTTDILDGVMADRGSDAAWQDHAASTNRLAASLVHGFTTRHRCQGSRPCRHRNHPRDAYHDGIFREALDLPQGTATLADYDSPLEWASVSKSEALALTHSAGGRSES